MLFIVFLRLCIAICMASQIYGFADWMTKDFCRRSMAVGEVLMNAEVTASDERTVRVFRGEQELHSGGVYIPGEVLEVRVSDSKPQYVLEVIGPASAQFTAGGCDGTRIANKPRVELNLPTSITSKDDKDTKQLAEESSEELEDDSDGSVKIHVAWATGHSTVYLSSDFILLPKASEITAPIPDEQERKQVVKEEKEMKSPVISEQSSNEKQSIKILPPAKSPVYVPSTVTTKNQAPLNVSLTTWQQSLTDFTSASFNHTLHTLKHHFPLHYYNQTTANNLVSRTGKLFSDLEKAALEELASSSGRVSQSLGGGTDVHDRVALQMQAREKRQQLEKEKKQLQHHQKKKTDTALLRGSHKTPHGSQHTPSESNTDKTDNNIDNTKSNVDKTMDNTIDKSSEDEKKYNHNLDNISLEQRKLDKMRTLQQQLHNKNHNAAQQTPPRTSLHFKETENETENEEEDMSADDTVILEKTPAVPRRHKNAYASTSRHPILRMLIRVILVLGLLFLGTICCGSVMIVWHSRHAMWRSLRRRLGFYVTGDDKQHN